MSKEQVLAVFEDFKIRRVYDADSETWFFSVVDIVAALIHQPDYQAARNYWKVLKNRLKKEGCESVTKCNRLKLTASDGKSYLTDVADPEVLLRIVQSVPSPKAEPIKLWLARVGYERIQDMGDPARSLDRARDYWRQHGRSEKWIQQRMMGQETRNKLTDYWKSHDVSGADEYAILTNIIHQEWAGVSVKEHKKIKGLDVQNLRDHMTEAELIFTALGGTFYAADCRKRTGHRHGGKRQRWQEGWRNCQAGPPGIGAEDWQKRGDRRKFPADRQIRHAIEGNFRRVSFCSKGVGLTGRTHPPGFRKGE